MEYQRTRCRRTIRTSRTHRQIAAYFDDYVDHFGFRDRIRFSTGSRAWSRRRTAVGRSTLDDGIEHRRYDAVLVANGHHWDPRWPEPAFPGEFHGDAIHAHHYKTPAGYEDKNVLVLGIGNSACDIAVETSRVSAPDLPGHAPRRAGSFRSTSARRRRDELAPECSTRRLPLGAAAGARSSG